MEIVIKGVMEHENEYREAARSSDVNWENFEVGHTLQVASGSPVALGDLQVTEKSAARVVLQYVPEQ